MLSGLSRFPYIKAFWLKTTTELGSEDISLSTIEVQGSAHWEIGSRCFLVITSHGYITGYTTMLKWNFDYYNDFWTTHVNITKK